MSLRTFLTCDKCGGNNVSEFIIPVKEEKPETDKPKRLKRMEGYTMTIYMDILKNAKYRRVLLCIDCGYKLEFTTS